VKMENNRLTALINDILNLAKLEAGKDKLFISEVNLSELTNDEMYVKYAEEKGIQIINEVPENFVVSIDSAKFKQVFINLVTNAINYTPEGGTIRISADDHGKEWSMSIKDDGKGIAKDNLEKLFQKFYQVEHYMTRTTGGTGLGLAIVKEIADLHGGRITVESELGSGSTFRVFIPRSIGRKKGKDDLKKKS
jgi:two-component system, OmpR family, phosphate regulon sensor histidine kinase PhoR